jgi:TolB-like protein/Tfp pilus assembly protein PilF
LAADRPDRAAEIYDGPLLDGLEIPDPEYEDWLLKSRSEVTELACAAFARAVEVAAESAEATEAIGLANRLVALDPLREGSHRSLMRQLHRSGDRAGALRQYQVCADLLRRELQVEPDAATRALLAEIRNEGAASVSGDPASSIPPPDRPRSVSDKPAIAVLPFDNMSGAPEYDYIGDGLSEEIIAALSDWRIFAVIARNSTFTYKGKSVDVTQAGAELGARYVVEGSFRSEGMRLRVAAQLIDSETGHHLWSGRYDRGLRDVFALQEEIAQNIAGAIEPELMQFEQLRIERKPVESLQAWELYVTGLNCIYSSTRRELERGAEIFTELRARHPRLSLGHAGWAFVHSWRVQSGWLAQDQGLDEEMLAAARQAVALDRNNALSHLALMMALGHLRDFDGALRAGRRAVLLNPSNCLAHWTLGLHLDLAGKHEAAIVHLRDAEALSPRDPFLWLIHFYEGLAHYQIGHYSAALEAAGQVLHERPRQQGAKLLTAAALAQQDQTQEAAEWIERYLEQTPEFHEDRLRQVFHYEDPQKFEHLMSGLRKAGLPE